MLGIDASPTDVPHIESATNLPLVAVGLLEAVTHLTMSLVRSHLKVSVYLPVVG